MTNQNDIQNKILSIAKANDQIRAVILNGSRADPNGKSDKCQDFDVVFIVKNFDSFLHDRSWIDVLGKPVL